MLGPPSLPASLPSAGHEEQITPEPGPRARPSLAVGVVTFLSLRLHLPGSPYPSLSLFFFFFFFFFFFPSLPFPSLPFPPLSSFLPSFLPPSLPCFFPSFLYTSLLLLLLLGFTSRSLCLSLSLSVARFALLRFALPHSDHTSSLQISRAAPNEVVPCSGDLQTPSLRLWYVQFRNGRPRPLERASLVHSKNATIHTRPLSPGQLKRACWHCLALSRCGWATCKTPPPSAVAVPCRKSSTAKVPGHSTQQHTVERPTFYREAKALKQTD